MAHSSWVLVGLTVAVTLPAHAQTRNINLTGAPLKAIEEPFTQISGVRELPGNKAVVVDRGEQKIMLVNFATGGVTNIGRKGGGPGEFESPRDIFAGPGTDSWVSDPQAGKVHVITAEGKMLDAILPPEGEGGMSIFMPRAVDAAGRFYQEQMPRFGAGPVKTDSLFIVRWDRIAKKTDTLGKVPSGMTVNTSGSSGRNMQVMVRTKPLAATPVWSALPDGRLVIVQPMPYRVDVIGANKVATRGPVQPYAPIKVTAAERDAYREQRKSNQGPMIVRSVGTGGRAGGTNTSVSSGRSLTGPGTPDEDFPEVMPPFSGQGAVRVSPDGEIWVLRTRPASDKTPSYDIFNGGGVLVGKATLKPNSAVVGFGAGVIYVARQDPEDDLQYLEKYSR